MSDEIKDLQKGITEILVAIGKIETEIKQLSDITVKVDNTERKVIQLEQSLKSLHKRVDGAEHDLEQFEARYDSDKRDNKEDRKWLIGAIPGVGAFIWKFMEAIMKGGV